MTTISRHIAIVAALALAALPLRAATVDSTLTLIDRTVIEEDLVSSLVSLAWDNPATHQLQRNYSYNQAGASTTIRQDRQDGENTAIDLQRGHRDFKWSLHAEAYIKYRTSTLWGNARYDNGHTAGMSWNETSDIDIVKPFLLADSIVSTRLKSERYSFAGGYADVHGPWLWGATLSYTAGLHYRSTDPRPRNVTGNLYLSVGGGRHISEGYVATLAISFNKYKQTNSVTFYSEMGNDKLFHLTGLTNDYGRFAGTAYSTYYKGYRWGAMLGVAPTTTRGLHATASAHRMSMDNVLTTLNKLPMGHLTVNTIEGEIAWRDQCWGVRGNAMAARRVGTMNIFGDAASSVYPQIGSHDIYHQNLFSAGVTGAWTQHWRVANLSLLGAVNYDHVNEVYASPTCHAQLNTLSMGLTARGTFHTGRSLLVAQGGWTLHHPTSDIFSVTGVTSELTGLKTALAHTHTLLSQNYNDWQARLAWYCPLGTKLALRVDAAYRLTAYAEQARCHRGEATITVLF